MGKGCGGDKENSLKQPKDTPIMFFENCIQFGPECSEIFTYTFRQKP